MNPKIVLKILKYEKKNVSFLFLIIIIIKKKQCFCFIFYTRNFFKVFNIFPEINIFIKKVLIGNRKIFFIYSFFLLK